MQLSWWQEHVQRKSKVWTPGCHPELLPVKERFIQHRLCSVGPRGRREVPVSRTCPAGGARCGGGQTDLGR